MMVIGSVAEVWPAEMVTLAGTVALVGSLDVRLTVRSLANGEGC